MKRTKRPKRKKEIRFGGSAVRVAKRRQKKRRKNDPQNLYFPQLYDKEKDYELPKPKINMERYFNFPKGAFEWGPTQKWHQQCFAVYPVMCSQAELFENKWFQISKRNIAKLTGISESAVNFGINRIIEGEYNFYDQETGEIEPYLEREMVQESRRR